MDSEENRKKIRERKRIYRQFQKEVHSRRFNKRMQTV